MATVRYENATRIDAGTEQPAVDRLDLAISDGEFLVLVEYLDRRPKALSGSQR